MRQKLCFFPLKPTCVDSDISTKQGSAALQSRKVRGRFAEGFFTVEVCGRDLVVLYIVA